MGKLKRRSKMAMARANKRVGIDGHGSGSNAEAKNLQKISPLLQKLSSPVPNDRSMAVSTISVLCEGDATLRKLFLKENLIKIIMEQCINDNNDEIVVDSFGLLRNLVIEEGYEVAIFLWRLDIWLSIENGLKKSIESISHLNDTETKNKNRAILFDFIENLVSLLGGIAECSDELFAKVLDKIRSLDYLQNFIKDIVEGTKFKVSTKVLVSTLGFIYDMSTLSMDFIELLHNEIKIDFNGQKSLEDRLGNNSLGKSFLNGLDFQLFEYEVRNGNIDVSTIDSKILQTFNNLFVIVSELNLEESMNVLKFPVDNAKDVEDKDAESRHNTAKISFQSIDVILDLITTLIEFKGESMTTTSEQNIDDQLVEFALTKISPFLTELLKHDAFCGKVMVCLNNLAWLMLSIDFNGQESQWQEATYPISSIVIPKAFELLEQGSKDESILSDLSDYLNSTWVLLKSNDKLLSEFQPKQIQSLIQYSSTLITSERLSNQANDDSVNLLTTYFSACIGLLSIFAKYSNDLETTKSCSQFIVDKTMLDVFKLYNAESNSNEVHKKYSVILETILNESINAIFEIFDDAAYPYDLPIFVEGKLLDVLKESYSQFKKVYKSVDKKKFTELKEKSEETLQNLERFIQYKESERN